MAEPGRRPARVRSQPYFLVDGPWLSFDETGEHLDRFAAFAEKAARVATDRLATQPAQASTVLAMVPATQVWAGNPGRVGKDYEGDISACRRRVVKHLDQPCRRRADGARIEDGENAASNWLITRQFSHSRKIVATSVHPSSRRRPSRRIPIGRQEC